MSHGLKVLREVGGISMLLPSSIVISLLEVSGWQGTKSGEAFLKKKNKKKSKTLNKSFCPFDLLNILHILGPESLAVGTDKTSCEV